MNSCFQIGHFSPQAKKSLTDWQILPVLQSLSKLGVLLLNSLDTLLLLLLLLSCHTENALTLNSFFSAWQWWWWPWLMIIISFVRAERSCWQNEASPKHFCWHLFLQSNRKERKICYICSALNGNRRMDAHLLASSSEERTYKYIFSLTRVTSTVTRQYPLQLHSFH